MTNRQIFIGAFVGLVVWYHADTEAQRDYIQTQRINSLESRLTRTEVRVKNIQNIACSEMNKNAPRPSMQLSQSDCEKYFAIISEMMAKSSDNQFPDNVLTPTPTQCAPLDQWCQIRRWSRSSFNRTD